MDENMYNFSDEPIIEPVEEAIVEPSEEPVIESFEETVAEEPKPKREKKVKAPKEPKEPKEPKQPREPKERKPRGGSNKLIPIIIAALLVVALAVAAVIFLPKLLGSSEPYIPGAEIIDPATHKHSYGKWETVTQPTCTYEGLRQRVCKCGQRETQPIEIINHDYTVWEVILKPTCVEVGKKERSCLCGHVDKKDIPATGHTEGDWIVESEPVGAINGSKYTCCIDCGEKLDSVIIDGYAFDYEVNNDGVTCTITGVIGLESSELVIPAFIDGYEVTVIGEDVSISSGATVEDGAIISENI